MKNINNKEGVHSPVKKNELTRRDFLKKMAGVVGVAAIGTLGTACGSDDIEGGDAWDLNEAESCRGPESCRGVESCRGPECCRVVESCRRRDNCITPEGCRGVWI
jgi:hypothetical protein